jgi:hypothetical protein
MFDDAESTKAWVDAIIRADTDILMLTGNAELAVAAFAAVCAAVVHGGMLLYSTARRKHVEATGIWQILMPCWTVGVHVQAVAFYILPLLTFLSFSPLLWVFMLYLWFGVVLHQWSLHSPSRSNKHKEILQAIPLVPPPRRRPTRH